MSNQGSSPYPNWDARFEEAKPQVEREIEDWYARFADKAGHPSEPEHHEGWLERIGEELSVLYHDVKTKLSDTFGVEPNPEERAEYERAWQDHQHWQERVRAKAEQMRSEGRLGGPQDTGATGAE